MGYGYGGGANYSVEGCGSSCGGGCGGGFFDSSFIIFLILILLLSGSCGSGFGGCRVEE